MSTKHTPQEITVPADMTRVCVDGLETPPYEDAVAYLRDTLGVYWIAYEDGTMDRMGSQLEAFGDDEVTLHPSEGGRGGD